MGWLSESVDWNTLLLNVMFMIYFQVLSINSTIFHARANENKSALETFEIEVVIIAMVQLFSWSWSKVGRAEDSVKVYFMPCLCYASYILSVYFLFDSMLKCYNKQ